MYVKAENIIICIVLLVSIIYMNPNKLHADNTIKLTLESAKSEYVLKEPVKFKITFTNVSETEQRIMGIDHFTMNMDCLWLEVTYPNGTKVLRIYSWYDVDGLEYGGPSPYRGEGLKPGESFVTYLYPNGSYGIKRKGIEENEKNRFTTFPISGEHKLRVVYKMNKNYVNLYRGKDGELWSNKITVTFREPTAVEEEILDPVWYDCPGAISKGDCKLWGLSRKRIKPLNVVIEKYPDHPMTKYAIFILGWVYNHYKPDKAIELFNMLRKKYPDFRYHEVRCGIADSYYEMGEKDKVVEIVNETIAADSSFKDVERLIQLKIHASLKINRFDWLKARQEGRDIFNKKTPVIEEN